jgi:hypothetical protein
MKFATFVLTCAAAIYAIPAAAHHSFAMFDSNKTTTLRGTVKEFEWTNPHSWLLLNVPNAQGKLEQWAIEAGAPAGLARKGWGPKTLIPGMKVAVSIHPLKDGTHGGQFLSVMLPDGAERALVFATGALPAIYPALATPAEIPANIPALASAGGGWAKIADDFQAPASGPGPVSFDNAHPYVPNNPRGEQAMVRIADLSNPILQPWAVERMKKANQDAAAGRQAFEARASCRPGGVPGFLLMGRVNPLYFVQTPKEVLMMNEGGPEIRHVYLNVPHTVNPKPSPYGESIGHYEGFDTLVVDTIGLSDDTFIDNYRTPHTTALHVVERFKRTEGGKTLEVSVSVDDPGTFNMSWSARQTYHPSLPKPFLETICAENNRIVDASVSPIPKAEKADF